MSKRGRFLLILGIIACCIFFLWPTINWYGLTPKEDQVLALGSLETIKDFAGYKASEDVKTLKALAKENPGAAIPLEHAYLIKEAKKNYKLLKKNFPKEPSIRDLLAGFQNELELMNAIETMYREQILKNKRYYNNSVKLGLDLSGGMSVIVKADLEAAAKDLGKMTPDELATFNDNAMNQAVETLRGRIDKFGLSEPVIRKQGENRIYIEIPGAAEVDSINSIIMGKGILNFRLVDSEATDAFNAHYAAHPAETFTSRGELLDLSIIPEDTEVLGLYTKDEYDLDERIGYLVVKKEIVLDGKHIKSADIGSNQYDGRPQVHFTLDSDGAVIFSEFTTANRDRYLAIVSDDKIKSYAKINEPIPNGQVAISGFGLDEANNLKKILQTAWLNVPLSVESQQVVGASLGETAIKEGFLALVFGLISVIIFMFLYYRGAGVNAVVAQVLNMFLLISILSAFNLTLTLPSIAGMILTIGMAVDANVIIFERIKEELRLGKNRAAAVHAGFDRAFWAIMDSNITTFIAAIFLSQLGTGAIQGFAVSLAIGVISSVFTALFVSRLIFDFGTDVLNSEKITISWRKIK